MIILKTTMGDALLKLMVEDICNHNFISYNYKIMCDFITSNKIKIENNCIIFETSRNNNLYIDNINIIRNHIRASGQHNAEIIFTLKDEMDTPLVLVD